MSSSLVGQTLLNRFRVDVFIASGTTGDVYRAWDLQRNVTLAIKVLHADLLDDPAIIKGFKRDARALEKLTHPNIIPFYGFYQTPNIMFLAMKFNDGLSLKELLRQRREPLEPLEVLVFMKAISAALGYAHAKEIVHCDVKPGNVLVNKAGQIFLTDFGIARYAESTTTTLAGAGTIAYMAPEQILEKPVSAATDIYALGTMLFEMLTGQRLFRSSKIGTDSRGGTEYIREAHLRQPPPDPRSVNSDIPQGLAQVILKALEKNPLDRYQSTQAMFVEMCTAIGITPESAPDLARVPALQASKTTISPTPPIPWSKQIGAYKGIVRTVGIGLLVFLASLMVINIINGVSKMGNPPTMPEIEISQNAPSASATPEKLIEPTSESIPVPTDTTIPSNEISTSVALTVQAQSALATLTVEAVIPVQVTTEKPTQDDVNGWKQGKLVYLVRVDANGQNRDMYVLNLINQTNPVKLYSPGKRLMGSVWSPDSSRIAFYEQFMDDFLIIDAYSGFNLSKITGCNQPAWAQNGEEMVCHGNLGEFFIVDLNSSTKQQSLQVGGNANLPDWSPLNNLIVYSVFESDGSTGIWIMSLEDGSTRLLAGQAFENYAPAWSHDGYKIAFQSAPKGGLSDIWIMDKDGNNARKLTNSGTGNWSRGPAWSPDDQWLVYVSTVAGSSGADYGELFIISINGGDPTQITNTGGRVYDWRVYWGR